MNEIQGNKVKNWQLIALIIVWVFCIIGYPLVAIYTSNVFIDMATPIVALVAMFTGIFGFSEIGRRSRSA